MFELYPHTNPISVVTSSRLLEKLTLPELKTQHISLIIVEPADKISFVYNCMETRLRGQYNGK